MTFGRKKYFGDFFGQSRGLGENELQILGVCSKRDGSAAEGVWMCECNELFSKAKAVPRNFEFSCFN